MTGISALRKAVRVSLTPLSAQPCEDRIQVGILSPGREPSPDW